ncbi:AMP-dependent synthetase and ligase [Flavobacterium indicum GPTSA100-9 = DSM 17447]|uniref:AMP-dependent synthetase and ligase n=1 Tax=Flavobacterium indicum (strain DSM 17447 / CIP 109464 / GPTSA100-9) TaxID=1094466 RepID=H8XTZ2_FLAIG|nr:AMP-binding protein [Flavobacterium indicum]CCG53722.1 AMP-dependent synthetase and ligase [Flavobacterium indicum GPTSA100-9 = DSM 17447]
MYQNLSYTFGASSTPLLGETIGQNLKRTVAMYPKNDAIVSLSQNFKCDYETLWQLTTQVAKGLIAKGIQKGDRVGIWSPNRYEWTILQYATARIGVILVNINPAYRTNELIYVINQSGLRMMVSPLEFKTSDYKKMLKKAARECSHLEQTIFFEQDWDQLLQLAELVSNEALETIESSVQFDEPVNLQYTSGTTGFPKGVTLSHHNILNNGYFIGHRLHYTEKDRVCIPVPFFHCFGMVIGNLACTTHGACMVIPSESFEANQALKAVQIEKCTSLYGVPAMFIAMLQTPEFDKFDLKSLRTGVMAGSPCPVEIMKQVQSKMYMREVSICYGMTETSPVSTQTKIGVPLEKQVSTVGTIQDHLEIKIINPDTGEIVPKGTSGELCTRGYSVMLKYWNNPEATHQVLDDAGWMHTGDLAQMDEEGYINITGRIKDVIIRGGENISPREIEEFLYTHEWIEDVQVIGVPDEKLGEAIMAWVKLKKNAPVTSDDLLQFCQDQIAHYKIPKYWKFVESFPMTVSGKVRKVEMREISIEELNLQQLLKIKTS